MRNERCCDAEKVTCLKTAVPSLQVRRLHSRALSFCTVLCVLHAAHSDPTRRSSRCPFCEIERTSVRWVGEVAFQLGHCALPPPRHRTRLVQEVVGHEGGKPIAWDLGTGHAEAGRRHIFRKNGE
jgi:hypothetical protein